MLALSRRDHFVLQRSTGGLINDGGMWGIVALIGTWRG